MMNVSGLIRRPVWACVASLLLVLAGVLALPSMPWEQFPEIAPPTVRVSFSYSGADASTLQKSVAVPLEEAINGVENYLYMTSATYNNGTGNITVYFRQGTDADKALINVQNRVSMAQSSLPTHVVESGISVRKCQNGTVRILSLYSPDDSFDQSFLFNYFKIHLEPRLARIPGVGDVALFGSEYAMRILFDPEKLASYGMLPSDVVASIQAQNLEFPMGALGADEDGEPFEYVVKYSGRLEEAEQFRRIVLRSFPDGRSLRLGDVAEVKLGARQNQMHNELAGHPAVNCLIAQIPGSHADEIIRQIDEVVRQASSELPEGMQIMDLMNVRDFLNESMKEVLRTLVEAVLLVVLVMFLFLRSSRALAIPVVTMLVSLLGTLAILRLCGFSLNMLTLFSLVLVIGIVVDDAIVVVEAVQTRLEQGETSPVGAAESAMQRILSALVTTSLVFMVVFIPTCFTGRAGGVFYTQFGVSMSIAVLLSTFHAIFSSPALCALLMRKTKRNNRGAPPGDAEGGWRPFRRGWLAVYRKGMMFLFRRLWIGGALLLLACGIGGFLFLSLRTGLIPNEDTGTLVVDVRTSPGSSLAETRRIADDVERRLAGIPQVAVYSRSVGMGMLAGPSTAGATFIIRLKHWDKRRGEMDDNLSVIRDIQRRLAGLTEARVVVFAQPIIPGYGVTSGFEVHLQDRRGGDAEALMAVAEYFVQELSSRPEIARAGMSVSARDPQYRVEVDSERCAQNGVNPTDVLETLSLSLGGQEISEVNLFSRLYKVVLQAASEYRISPSSLERLYVRNAQGKMSPLGHYIRLVPTNGNASLTRFNMFSSVMVTGSPAEGYSSGQALEAIREVASQALPTGYGYELGAMSREEDETRGGGVWILFISVLVVYLILCILYESFALPLAVLVILPFGLVGSLAAAFCFGVENNIYLQVGTVMLMGLLSKTSILVVDQARTLSTGGMSPVRAVLHAVRVRTRPVVMTVLTLVLGLSPMAFASGVGSHGAHSLAVGVIGGMLGGTGALFVFVPLAFFLVAPSRKRKREEDTHKA